LIFLPDTNDDRENTFNQVSAIIHANLTCDNDADKEKFILAWTELLSLIDKLEFSKNFKIFFSKRIDNRTEALISIYKTFRFFLKGNSKYSSTKPANSG